MALLDQNIFLRTGEFYADVASAYDDLKYNVVSATHIYYRIYLTLIASQTVREYDPSFLSFVLFFEVMRGVPSPLSSSSFSPPSFVHISVTSVSLCMS